MSKAETKNEEDSRDVAEKKEAKEKKDPLLEIVDIDTIGNSTGNRRIRINDIGIGALDKRELVRSGVSHPEGSLVERTSMEGASLNAAPLELVYSLFWQVDRTCHRKEEGE